MRFRLPATPTESITTPEPTDPIQCWQVKYKSNPSQPGEPFLGRPDFGGPAIPESEDCLFLDIYVPASLLASGTPPPTTLVIVWFYGGAFILGSKGMDEPNNPLYNGLGAIDAAKKFGRDVIFVAGN